MLLRLELCSLYLFHLPMLVAPEKMCVHTILALVDFLIVKLRNGV